MEASPHRPPSPSSTAAPPNSSSSSPPGSKYHVCPPALVLQHRPWLKYDIDDEDEDAGTGADDSGKAQEEQGDGPHPRAGFGNTDTTSNASTASLSSISVLGGAMPLELEAGGARAREEGDTQIASEPLPPPPPRFPFFTRSCSASTSKLLILYGLALTAFNFFGRYVQRELVRDMNNLLCMSGYEWGLTHIIPIPFSKLPQGLILLSLLPACFMLGYTERLFQKSVLRREMLLTFLVTIIFMSPLVVFENFFSFGTFRWSS